MLQVIIAEKPSVARNIAEALGLKQKRDGYIEGPNYIVTWAFGHLLQLYDAKDYDKSMSSWSMFNFPFIPKEFKYKIKTSPANRNEEDPGATKQINIIKSLINKQEVSSVISACDYDREGQIIGDILLDYLKIDKPVFRLLLNEWTSEEVLRGLDNLKPNVEVKSLQDAGVSRQWADWVIGINLTSVTTLKYLDRTQKGKPLNIGRVLLPTLKIIYDRDKEIENFIPNDYHRLIATFKTNKDEKFDGIYTVDGQEKFNDKKELENLLKDVKEKTGTIIDKQVERKRDYPPYLFNLSGLQGQITSKYKGWTSDKVLKVAQKLYEQKHITYPRTSSIVLDETLISKANKVLNLLKKGLPFEDEIKFSTSKRIFDSSKVESHSAIIPTYILPKRLTEEENIVYQAVKNRFIAQFMPLAEYEETRITTKINETNISGVFISKGKVQITEGWKKVENIESKDIELPLVDLGETVDVHNIKVNSTTTKPPKHHNEKTLLRMMEVCGKKFNMEESNEMMDAILSGFSIGTPATRAETIKKLKDIGYIYSKDKYLICSALGRKIVEIFPIKELLDLEYTGRLEKTLLDIEKSKVAKDNFLSLIFNFTKEAVQKIKIEKNVNLNEITSAENKVTKEKHSLEILGKCPLCGNAIIEGKKGFGCSNWKNGCKFVMWKNDDFFKSINKKLTKTLVKKILKDGKVEINNIKRPDSTQYTAMVSYNIHDVEGDFVWTIT